MNFDGEFAALTGNPPFPWQKRLYERFCVGDIPAACNIPTGLGKTSVIAVWVLALANRNPEIHLPRRLIYVVNRRTIVDQSTAVVSEIRDKLQKAEIDSTCLLHETAMALKALSAVADADGELLAVSTLRGELADNQQWRFDPMRPAVMIGTVDMIGSKLLFSGYGDGRRVRPLHAGFVGCDTLIVHDEAHLSPAFSRLLWTIERFSGRGKPLSGIPPMRLVELSATSRTIGDDSGRALFQIDDSDRNHEIVKKRLKAPKQLRLHAVEEKNQCIGKIVDLALQHNTSGTRVVVFVRSPEDAVRIHDMLIKKRIVEAEAKCHADNDGKPISKNERAGLEQRCGQSVSILTGEIRGHERDKLLKTPGMMPFIGKSAAEDTVYLVSTSAGEVGMDLHADHMVSDLASLDSMIQRLGRVNRFGGSEAMVDVVYEAGLLPNGAGKQRAVSDNGTEDTDSSENEGEKTSADNKPKDCSILKNTLILLKRHIEKDSAESLDVSPSALLTLLQESQAVVSFSLEPEMTDVTDILLDLWSQTSFNDIPARPQVAPWLHGIQPNLPETWIAWRREVSLFGDPDLSEEDIAAWFQKFPLSSRETLRKPTYRLKWTSKAEKAWLEKHSDVPVVLLLPNGEAMRMRIAELPDADVRLNFATIVFPTEAGGLNDHGFFDVEIQDTAVDVADDSVDRIILERIGDYYRFFSICEWKMFEPEILEDTSVDSGWPQWLTWKDAMRTIEKALNKTAMFRLQVRKAKEWEDDPHECWLLLLKSTESRKRPTKTNDPPTIEAHNRAVAEIMRRIAGRTELPKEIKEALFLAASHHDIGKAHELWQRAAGHHPTSAFAKPASGGINNRILSGYRHELGSVLEGMKNESIRNHPECDLILHLIATHHGWARPHFNDEAFPPGVNEEIRNQTNLDIMKRFVRLQEHFGYWGLAWLESLLRRADGVASMQQGADEEASDE
ncbi:type I-G CRISPR-associated helicase/endonuclease Cas3g [Desulfatirhabdium butyrativorans]|uniref:type I-G CRISPR-associated helicase/endonuclease Cas3g n=1 Tax=Desulfatirhabdium butyrativorans TaxID=340467 RepID=UPI0004142C31|nr:type I-U CRISPR-associated helicase/endonuclease Cas3 [Desulfatirhabdium butyrativorans]